MKIAIVDDDPIFQFMTHKLIEKIAPAHSLLRFDNGREAFDFIQTRLPLTEAFPELILLDINMPHMNGWEFLDSLRNLQAAHYQPIIYLVSSSSDPADLVKSQTYAELKGYLNKPLSRQQLTELLILEKQDSG